MQNIFYGPRNTNAHQKRHANGRLLWLMVRIGRKENSFWRPSIEDAKTVIGSADVAISAQMNIETSG